MKLTKRYYQNTIEEHTIKKRYFKRFFNSFFFGGLICLFSQVILEIASLFNEEHKVEIMLFVVILLAILSSGVGIYDKLGQIAYSGSIVPISGFANSVASSAMEYKPEGYYLGIAANMFKLAGSVIAYGVIATIIVGLLRIGLSYL